MRRWFKQPHFKLSAMHPFFGSTINYLLFLLSGMGFVVCSFLLIQNIYQLTQANTIDAQVEFIDHSSSEDLIVFNILQLGLDKPYIVLPVELVAKTEQAESDDILNVPIRYIVTHEDEIQVLYPLSQNMQIFYVFMGMFGVVIFVLGLWFLSPYPIWYWKRAEINFQRLSGNALKIEVRLQGLNELKICPRTANRTCHFTSKIFLPNIKRDIHFNSPQFIVDSKFHMSYPFITIYINLKNMNEYEVDLPRFFKNNASCLHGYTEQDRMYPSEDPEYAKVG